MLQEPLQAEAAAALTAQLSNSLSMCSCTLVASLVPRMDNSSSSCREHRQGQPASSKARVMTCPRQGCCMCSLLPQLPALAHGSRRGGTGRGLQRCDVMMMRKKLPATLTEMKKKRGNAQRLVSKYSDRDFWHSSSCSDRFCAAAAGHGSMGQGQLVQVWAAGRSRQCQEGQG